MAADKKKIANDCWKTGSEAVNKGNWDYAIAMFQKSVQLVPENLVYRQSLRGAQFKKYDNNKKGEGMWAKRKLVSIRSKISKAKAKEEWDALDIACEEGLVINPWDVGLNISLGDACTERGYDEIAVFAYSIACGPDGDPKNRNNLAKFATLLGNIDKYDEAVKIWRMIQALDPQDKEARSMITKLQADKMIDRGGYEGAETTKDVLPDHEVSKRLGKNNKKNQAADGPGQSEEADIERAIRKNPEDRDLYLKLGELHRKSGKMQPSLEAFRKANEISGGDHHIEEIIEDIELVEMRKEVELAIRDANEAPGDKEKASRAMELKKNFLVKELEVYKKREKSYPQDMKLKLKLAQLYIKTKNWSTAIPLLQRACSDVRLEVIAASLLGKCFLQDNQPSLALRQFKKVAPNLKHEDHPDLFLEVNYYLGRLYEQGKKYPLAEEHYGEVLSFDYEYKDIRKRLDDIASEDD